MNHSNNLNSSHFNYNFFHFDLKNTNQLQKKKKLVNKVSGKALQFNLLIR